MCFDILSFVFIYIFIFTLVFFENSSFKRPWKNVDLFLEKNKQD